MTDIAGNIRNALSDFAYSKTADENVESLKTMGAIINYLEAINVTDDDLYAQFFNKKNGNIISVADYSGTVAGTIKITVEDDGYGHKLGDVGDVVSIALEGTTDYNNDPINATLIDAYSFYVTETWTQTRTGTWREIVTLGTTAPDFTKFIPKGNGVDKAATLMELQKGVLLDNGILFAVTKEIDGSTAPDSDVELVIGFQG